MTVIILCGYIFPEPCKTFEHLTKSNRCKFLLVISGNLMRNVVVATLYQKEGWVKCNIFTDLLLMYNTYIYTRSFVSHLCFDQINLSFCLFDIKYTFYLISLKHFIQHKRIFVFVVLCGTIFTRIKEQLHKNVSAFALNSNMRLVAFEKIVMDEILSRFLESFSF